MNWLTDHVYAIREAATGILKQLIDKFGSDWANEKVIPRIVELAQDSNYLHRMTCLFCFNAMVKALTPQLVTDVVFKSVEIVISLSNSRIYIFLS
jgi:serine/threonine-protein phosphatase 2A regulatory subunit A